MTRVTLAEVADRAGVSRSTASLAFSGAGPVAEDTRARVLAAAAELGYAGPDPLARSLRRGRSGVVGVVIGGKLRNAFRDPVTVTMLDGLAEELSGLGSSLLLLPSAHQPSTGSPLAGVALDALVFATCGADDDPLIAPATGRGIPMVGVEGPHRAGIPLVDLPQRESARSAAAHLAELGHRRVAVVTLPLRSDGRRGPVDPARRAAAGFAVSRERLAGVYEVFTQPTVLEAATNLVEEGERAGHALLSGPEPPTAVLAQSDLLAVGVIRAARRAGLRVPDDLSVTGFDGIDTAGWLGDAQLTTVEQPAEAKGRAAGQMVAELLAGRTPDSLLLPARLRTGTTTAPPAP